MTTCKPSEVTRLLRQLDTGDRSEVDQLFAAVYKKLRNLAGHFFQTEPKGNTLQPTALVHEAYMKLVDQTQVDWQGRTHFFAVAAQAMRRILVDHARRRGATKRGGNRHRIALDDNLVIESNHDEDLLALENALTRLTKLDPRQAQMIELRFFGGLSVAEVAKVMGISTRSVEQEWTMVRAWLRRELTASDMP